MSGVIHGMHLPPPRPTCGKAGCPGVHVGFKGSARRACFPRANRTHRRTERCGQGRARPNTSAPPRKTKDAARLHRIPQPFLHAPPPTPGEAGVRPPRPPRPPMPPRTPPPPTHRPQVQGRRAQRTASPPPHRLPRPRPETLSARCGRYTGTHRQRYMHACVCMCVRRCLFTEACDRRAPQGATAALARGGLPVCPSARPCLAGEFMRMPPRS